MKDRGVWVIVFLFCFLQFTLGKQYHISTTGNSNGDGSINNPWSIDYGLTRTASIQGGDSVCFHAGTYKGNWDVYLSGSSGKYITIIPFENDEVILDGVAADDHHATLDIRGNYIIVKDLRITNTLQNRYSSEAGSDPTDYNETNGIAVASNYVKIINCIIDNSTGTGIGSGVAAIGTEIYGNIIYHFGWQGTDRGHSHGIYCKNSTGLKIIENNISFNGFQYPLQVGGTNTASVTGFKISGNIGFGDGALQIDAAPEGVFLIGGGNPAENVVVSNNYLYQPKRATNIQLGYSETTINNDITLTNNVFAGGYYSVEVRKFQNMEFTDNVLVAGYRNIRMLTISDLRGYNFSGNQYYYNSTSTFHFNGTTSTFSTWQSNTSLDANSNAINGKPANIIRIEPNKYERNRAHIAIFNFENRSSVTVDLSSALEKGVEFEIYDVENLLGNPVVSGTYNGGSISIPMNLTEIINPIAPTPSVPSHTSSEFGAFLLKAKNPDKTVVSQPCAIQFDNITAETDQFVDIDFSFTGNCSSTNAYLYNSDNQLIASFDNINSGNTINLPNSCLNCPSGTYSITIQNNGSQENKKFTYNKPDCFDLTLNSYSPQTITDTLLVDFCTYNQNNISYFITDSNSNKIETKNYLAQNGVNYIKIPFVDYENGLYKVYFSDGINSFDFEVIVDIPLNPLTISAYSPKTTYNSVTISYYSPIDQIINWNITDSNNTTVKNNTTNARAGFDNSATIDVSELNNGTYTITLSDPNSYAQCIIIKEDAPLPLEITNTIPTETTHTVTVTYYSPVTGIISSSILDANNIIINSEEHTAIKGANNQIEIDFINYPNGEYSILLSDGNTDDLATIFKVDPPRVLELISYSPQATTREISFNFFSPKDQIINLQVLDRERLQVLVEQIEGKQGELNLSTLDISNLWPGEYTVVISDEQSSDFFSIERLEDPRFLEITDHNFDTNTNIFQLYFYSEIGQNVTFEIDDINGNLIYTTNMQITQNQNTTTFDFSEYEAGTYTVILDDNTTSAIISIEKTQILRTLEVLNVAEYETSANTSFTYYSPKNQFITIEIFNSQNIRLQTNTIQATVGENTDQIDLSIFDIGEYTVYISDDSTSDSFNVLRIDERTNIEITSHATSPISHQVNFDFYSPKNQTVNIEVINSSNNQVYTENTNAIQGFNTRNIDLSEFDADTYTIILSDDISSDFFTIQKTIEESDIEIISFSPQVTMREIAYTVYSPSNQIISISIVDTNNNKLYQETINASIGENPGTINLANFETGDYTITFSGSNNSDSFIATKIIERNNLEILSYEPSITFDLINIEFYSPSYQNIDITVRNNSGQDVYSENFVAIEGEENKTSINLESINAGEYIVYLESEQSTAYFPITKQDKPDPLEILSHQYFANKDSFTLSFYSPEDVAYLEILNNENESFFVTKILTVETKVNTYSYSLANYPANEYTILVYNDYESDSFVITKNEQKPEKKAKYRIIRHSPSPTADLMSVEFYAPQDSYIDIQVLDINGSNKAESVFSANKGVDNKIDIDISELDEGEYTILIGDNDTGDMFSFEKVNIFQPLEITSCIPNPTKGPVKVSYFSPKDNLIRLSLYNSDGQLLFSEFYEAEAGYGNIVHLKIPGSSEGHYILQISDGKTIDSYRIIRE